MKKKPLNITWVRWRRRRYQSLSAQGCLLAWEIADGEARARRRLVPIVGLAAAREAKLLCAFEGDTVRFFLSGSIEGLSPERLEKIQSTPGGGQIISL